MTASNAFLTFEGGLLRAFNYLIFLSSIFFNAFSAASNFGLIVDKSSSTINFLSAISFYYLSNPTPKTFNYSCFYFAFSVST